ncbi:THAP domain-containing protein 2-like [Actinia tenebrosa]|uniref:THAP domain-containing protein 2-like n=1 Tax=Actinia tenebrosa TaxID=6105 RepID=A0A6P8H8K3_ACTTE|nr:THAP domain-containing protein 2-like [Actinia tenebrosa]
MPANRCVVFGCNNFANKSNGISLHYSPKNKQDGDKWKRFVRLHRANFNPPGRFVVCSLHFEEKVFARALHIEGMQRRLLPRATPTIWLPEQQQETSVSDRSRRHALKNILQPAKNVEEEAEQMAANSHLEVDEVED